MMLLMALMLGFADDRAPTPIEPAKLERKEPVDYAEVLAIFKNRCLTCHSGKELQGQYDMGTHAGVMKGGKRKTAAVVAGKPLDSNLYLFSTHRKKPVMPPKSEANDLTPNEVAVLKLWIEQRRRVRRRMWQRIAPRWR